MKLEEMTPHERNPRKISDKRLAMLKASFEEFGPLHGIVFNLANEKLVAGHQHQKAIEHGEIVKQDVEQTKTGTVEIGHVLFNGERFPYRGVMWDEARHEAALIAANKQGGSWDLPKLTNSLLRLDELNIDMDLTGFDDTERENLLAPKDEKTKDTKVKILVCPHCNEAFEQSEAKKLD